MNLSNALSVALLYIDSDEEHFKRVKSLVNELHSIYGVKKVCALGFIDLPEKAIPVYHAQKLEYMYFTRNDLNWHLSPNAALANFLSEPYDLLIDLSTKPCLPLQYVVKASKARMKVGTGLADAGQLYDICIQPKSSATPGELWESILHYLTKPNLK